MSLRYLKITCIAAVLSLGSALAVFASPDFSAPRSIPATSEIQLYYAVHGVDQTLKTMVRDELKNELDMYGNPPTISTTLGTTTFTLSSDLVSFNDTSAIPMQNGSSTAATQSNS